MSTLGFDFYRTHIPPEIISLVPESLARTYSVVPVRSETHAIIVARADPDDLEVLDALRFVLNGPVEMIFATPQAIRFALDKNYPPG